MSYIIDVKQQERFKELEGRIKNLKNHYYVGFSDDFEKLIELINGKTRTNEKFFLADMMEFYSHVYKFGAEPDEDVAPLFNISSLLGEFETAMGFFIFNQSDENRSKFQKLTQEIKNEWATYERNVRSLCDEIKENPNYKGFIVNVEMKVGSDIDKYKKEGIRSKFFP